jgi:hypothetical protein
MKLDEPAPSGDGADADAAGSGCDSASETKGDPNEPSGCCADADVEDKNGLEVDICVRLGDEVTAAMWSCCNVVVTTGSGFGGADGGTGADAVAGGVVCVGADDDDADTLLC